MSANTIRLSALIHFLAALASGLAAVAGCGVALASVMVSRGMGPAPAWPFATAAVCAGCLLGGWLLALLQKSRGLIWGGLLGLVYAVGLLAAQYLSGGILDGAQLVCLGLMVLSGAARGELRPPACREEAPPLRKFTQKRKGPVSAGPVRRDKFLCGSIRNQPKKSFPFRLPPRPPRTETVGVRPDQRASPGPAAPEKHTADWGRQSAPAAVPRARGGRLTRECAALACAYLFGSLLSGVFLSLCQASELETLSAYLGHWSSLFVLDEPGAVWELFGSEYLTVAGGATVLLLLGLSAFGPVMIYLFAMLFGLGVGIIGLQLFLYAGWKSAAAGLLLSGLPTAAAVTCLCLFGASALGVSGRLQRAAFSRRDPLAAAGARRLLGQYLMVNVLFLPICGVIHRAGLPDQSAWWQPGGLSLAALAPPWYHKGKCDTYKVQWYEVK